MITLPAELDLNIYRQYNPDLQAMDDANLRSHWQNYGSREGRIASSVINRDEFLACLSSCRTLLEIGVFDKPSLQSLQDGTKTIHYADWLGQSELIERARITPGRDPDSVPPIRYKLSEGYEQIKIKYDAVISHHCIEHQPDLIRHFQTIHSLLSPQGCYLMSIPDKRRVFDHFIPETTIVDLLTAYYEKRVKPTFRSVLEHRCFTAHNWQNNINPYTNADVSRLTSFKNAYQEYCDSDYVDVHCWEFSPSGFRELLEQLVDYEFIPKPSNISIYSNNSEFYVGLQF